jgi:hypothetical protein
MLIPKTCIQLSYSFSKLFFLFALVPFSSFPFFFDTNQKSVINSEKVLRWFAACKKLSDKEAGMSIENAKQYIRFIANECGVFDEEDLNRAMEELRQSTDGGLSAEELEKVMGEFGGSGKLPLKGKSFIKTICLFEKYIQGTTRIPVLPPVGSFSMEKTDWDNWTSAPMAKG